MPSSERHRTTPPERPSTRRRRCSAWAIPAGRRSRNWPRAATRAASTSRAPSLRAARSTLASAGSRPPRASVDAAAIGVLGRGDLGLGPPHRILELSEALVIRLVGNQRRTQEHNAAVLLDGTAVSARARGPGHLRGELLLEHLAFVIIGSDGHREARS